MMGEAQAPGGLGKARALLVTMICLPLPFWVLHAVPPLPVVGFSMGGPGYLSCILRARRTALAIL